MHKLNVKIIIKAIVAMILSAMLMCLAAILFFMYSNSGFYYLTNALSSYYDVEVNISASSGTLAHGINIEQATIASDNIKVNLTSVNLKHSLQHILNMPQLNIEKMLLSSGTFNTTVTDINIITDSHKNNQINFKVPKYNISSQTDLKKHKDEYDIVTNLNFNGSSLELVGSAKAQNLILKNNPSSAINADIKVSWNDALRWDIKATNKETNDNLQSLDFYSHGTQNDFIFELNKLQAVLAKKPLTSKLIYKKHNALQSLYADIIYSKNEAEINFDMAEDMSLKADIKATDLSEIMPESLGAITAKIDVTGSMTNPKANITLNAENVLQGAVSIDSLAADISLGENGNHNINANIESEGTRYKNIYRKQSSLHIDGDLSKHTISIDSLGETDLTSVIEGSYANETWSAKITKLALDNKHSNLRLTKPDDITISNNKIKNTELCFANKAQTICARLMFRANDHSWQADVKTEHFDLKSLSSLNLLSDLITIKSGSIAGDIILKSDKPGAVLQNGYLNIKDAKLYLKKQNIYPLISSLNIKAKDYTSTVEGEIISENKNKASIAGSIQTKNKLEAEINVKGNKILLYNTNNINLIASPDIMLYLHDYLNITGKIDIPQAKLNIKDDDAVTLPNDIVIANYYDENKSNFMTLGPKTALTINFLDDISIEMQKIYSKIKGSLLLNVSSENQVLATGTIETYDGSFSKYGQKLDIERGKLIYDKDPINSPWINIEATRSINLDNNDDIRSLEKIIVGIIISGHINSPDITLFSNPNKYTENEILSLLLTGSLSSIINDDGISDGKSDNFYSMLLGKNFIQSLGVLNQLSDKLSLNQITIGGSINENQTGISSKSPINITMSKNINDRLRLIGTFGIYSDDYSLSAIYNINKNIMLKGYTNQLSHGLNMLYKFTAD